MSAGYSNFNRHGEDYFPLGELVKFGQTQNRRTSLDKCKTVICEGSVTATKRRPAYFSPQDNPSHLLQPVLKLVISGTLWFRATVYYLASLLLLCSLFSSPRVSSAKNSQFCQNGPAFMKSGSTMQIQVR